jgi:hypothetical protein
LHVDNSLIDDLSFSRLYKLERASAIGQFSFLKFPIKAEAIDDREPCGSQQLNSQKLTLCPSEQPSTSSVGALISLAGMQHHPRNKYSRVEYTVEEPPETDDEIRSQAYGYGQSNEKTIYNGIQNSDPADV